MTKPIEGWVAYNSSIGVYEHDVLVPGQRCTPVFLKPAQINTGDKFIGWEFRPVQLTFTDEPSTEVADAIRKDRERIWEEFKSLWPYELNDKARKMIFGEEK